MQSRRWLNQGQPQTLVIACFLLYIDAAFALLGLFGLGGIAFSGLRSFDYSLLIAYYLIRILGGVLGGYGVANELKWGYLLALGTALAPFVIRILLLGNPFAADLITLIFEIALVALLLHTQSREYERIWFK